MRAAIVVAVACLSAAGLCAGQDVQASIKKSTNIPAQQLAPALKALAYERGFQVVFLSEVVRAKETQGAVGELTTTEALTRLLEGTNLKYSYLDDKTVTIFPVNSNDKLDQQGASAGNLHRCSGLSSNKLDYATSLNWTTSDSTSIGWTASEGAPDCVESDSIENQVLATRIASAEDAPVQNSDGESSLNKDSTEKEELTEIIVTAQKREERLQDVPVPVTAIDAQSLVDSNQLRLQDYYAQVPGLAYSSGLGKPSLVIRGLTTAGGNPTVGIVVDDVPYGSSQGSGGGGFAPDVDPSNLKQVEVLRGPQGTLYGANSIGGLIKFATLDPSTDAVSGRVQASTSSVNHGDKVGYGFRGAINVPLSDTFAVRASAFTREDPGYIDNVLTGEDGINRVNTEGGRLAALWRPSEVFSLKLGALYQYSNAHGGDYADVLPGLNERQEIAVRGSGFSHQHYQVYSATGTLKLGAVDVTSISGYSINQIDDSFDYSSEFGAFVPIFLPGVTVTGATVPDHNTTRKFTQEVRLAAPLGQHIDWLLGAFYTHENSPTSQELLAVDPLTGVVAGSIAKFDFPSTYKEYAAFTDLTFHLTSRFDVQVGGRESRNIQTYSEVDSGPLVDDGVNGGVVVNPETETKANAFTYLVTPSFKLSPDLMVYARLASGYRIGGPNASCVLISVPCQFKPDTTENYELGVKGDLSNHALEFDASLYYIDWKDIAVSAGIPGGFGYVANAGRAKSQGVELSIATRPRRGLKIAAWVAWNDAELTQDLPALGSLRGADGDRLPFSSRVSGNLSLEQEFLLTSSVRGFVGGSVSYVGDREGFLQNKALPPDRDRFPGYARTDIRAGVSYRSWTANIFVNNLLDKQAILSGLVLGNPVPRLTYLQPRTVGVSFSKSF